MFSKACEYGIRALIFIASKSNANQRVNISDIAAQIDSPAAFTAKILQHLVRADIVHSAKGPSGGFEITQDQISNTRLADIVMAIDGDGIYNGCGLGLKECSESKPCPLHERFKQVRADLKSMLEATRLQDLAAQLDDGVAYLKI